MGSETTYFTIDDDGNNQILGYANLMSMGGEEEGHLEEGDGGSGLEDLQFAVDEAQSAVDDLQGAVTGTEAMVTSASAEVDELQTLLASAESDLAGMVEEDDADAYAAKLAEITGIEIDVADAQQTLAGYETALSEYETDLAEAQATLTSAQEALDAADEEDEDGDEEGDDDDEETPSFFRVDYNDADWNYLGSSYSDEFGSGYNFNEVIDGIRYEKGSENRYKVNIDDEVVVDEGSGEPIISHASSYEYRFDEETGDMLGGTQVNGPTTITYGANFEIVSSVTEIDTTGGDFMLVDGSGLPTALC